MRGNFSIGPGFVRGCKNSRCFGLVAQTKFDPSQTVLDERVGGCELHRFEDQFTRFWQTDIAVCQ